MKLEGASYKQTKVEFQEKAGITPRIKSTDDQIHECIFKESKFKTIKNTHQVHIISLSKISIHYFAVKGETSLISPRFVSGFPNLCVLMPLKHCK